MNAPDPPPIASKSLLGSMASVSQRRWLGVLAVTLAFLAAALVFALWVLFPWGPIDGFAVESAQRTTTPPRIHVIFSTPTPLEAVLKRKDAGFINATLSDCRSDDRRESEVAAQRAGYFPDEGRVRRLSPSGGGAVERI